MITAIVYTIVFVLAFPTLGYAECAWVLWNRTAGVWLIFGSFDNKKQCVTELQREGGVQTSEARILIGDSEEILLPDTVDPRGAKVK